MADSWQSDYVVVGGGTAGCILAARLSEAQDRTVTLIEAGPDYVPESAVPSQLRLLERISLRHDWDYVSEPEPFLGDQRIRLPRGKLVGGCSRLHLGLALEPTPADFEQWADGGLSGWTSADVAPYFRRVRASGLAAHLRPREAWTETQRAFFEASLTAGFVEITAAEGDGIGITAIPVAEEHGMRLNAAASYLTTEVRARPNMRIVSDTTVASVGFESNRARHVNSWSSEGEALCIEAARGVVLAAGVFGTPAILQRSGIGDAAHLQLLGINIIRDRPLTGEDLQDHPLAVVDVPIRHDVSLPPDHVFDVLLKASSASDSDSDLHLLVRSVIPRRRRERRPPFIRFLVGLMRPRARGSVSITSSNSVAPPSIHLNYLGEPEDRVALERGLVTLSTVISQPALTGLLQQVPAAAFTLASATMTTYQHAVGTCRMGVSPENSIVNQRCRLHGFENLWIGDASVIPRIPGVNTLLTAAMLAERASDFVAEDS